ncbi:hypothetical protein D3C78_1530840 [compost metagenome]
MYCECIDVDADFIEQWITSIGERLVVMAIFMKGDPPVVGQPTHQSAHIGIAIVRAVRQADVACRCMRVGTRQRFNRMDEQASRM